MAKLLFTASSSPILREVSPAWSRSPSEQARTIYQATIRPSDTDCDQYIERITRQLPEYGSLLPLLRVEFNDARARMLGMR